MPELQPHDLCIWCSSELEPVHSRTRCPNCHALMESCCDGGERTVGGVRPDPNAQSSSG